MTNAQVPQTAGATINIGVQRRQLRGFTLIEVMLALLILAASLLGSAMISARSLAEIRAASSHLKASYLLADLAALVSINRSALAPGDSVITTWLSRVPSELPQGLVAAKQKKLRIANLPLDIEIPATEVTLTWPNGPKQLDGKLNTSLAAEVVLTSN
jgi:prepilin-type N-terminal cleavage/methylation domain-containing protein